MFRLKQKHSKRRLEKPAPADAAKLIGAQSVRSALIAAIGSAVVLIAAWMWITATTGRFFPWFGVMQGALIGMAVQRQGRGLDWRFPTIAGVVAFCGSLAGGFFVALSTTEVELQASALNILRGLTSMTWDIYFDEVVTPVDYIYAFAAVALAVYYARRRLNRNEVYALRSARAKDEKRGKE